MLYLWGCHVYGGVLCGVAMMPCVWGRLAVLGNSPWGGLVPPSMRGCFDRAPPPSPHHPASHLPIPPIPLVFFPRARVIFVAALTFDCTGTMYAITAANNAGENFGSSNSILRVSPATGGHAVLCRLFGATDAVSGSKAAWWAW